MQIPSLKLLLKKNKQNALGQYPIYLRITANRKTTFITTGHAIGEKYWDEKNESVKESHKLHKQINEAILIQKKNMMDQIIKASMTSKNVTAKSLKEGQKKQLTDIFKFADNYALSLRDKRSKSLLDNWQKHLRKLEAFNNSRELNFDDINLDFLNSFEEHLRSTVKKRGEDGSSYIEGIMRTIRTFFNAARKRGLINTYPFALYEMPKTRAGNKAFLSLKELDRWHRFTLETEHPTLKQTALYFLFACYTGSRLSDWSDFAESKMSRDHTFQAIKNKAWVAIPLHERLIEILGLMKKVPLTIKESTINRNLKVIANELKIEKSLSTHCGRKSFAVTLCLERGVSSETTAKLMGITLAVFEKSYSFITKERIRDETAKAWKGL
jgi:site-specific recombinase XerD